MNSIYDNIRGEGEFDAAAYAARVVDIINNQVRDDKVLLALSGGVDSSVCAALIAKAVPNRLHCIFVDHGLMRKDEGDQIEAAFSGTEMDFIRVNAGDRFLSKLAGVTDPESKRKVIGEEFIRVFEDESKKLRDVSYLAQGTILPDVAESGANGSAMIKSHHNVGGLPADMGFRGLVEPLRSLYKDEVRSLGRYLGLPGELVMRQPFPGPGLAVRCLGEVTKEKLAVVAEADAIFRSEIELSGIHADQYFAVLTDSRSVGIRNNSRVYGWTIALRAVTTKDFTSCEYVPLPHTILGKVAERITSAIPSVTRVAYDITNKPPSTIEFE